MFHMKHGSAPDTYLCYLAPLFKNAYLCNEFVYTEKQGVAEMETDRNILTDEKWSAIIRNDASYDGVFYYAIEEQDNKDRCQEHFHVSCETFRQDGGGLI